MEQAFNKQQKIIIDLLEPVAEYAFNTHVNNKDTKEWLPGQLVPFEKADYQEVLDSATKSAIYVNGLTEDNLAHYTSTLKRLFGREGVWAEWNNRWTWEESLHGRVIERYIDHIGIFDNSWLESARKVQLTSGNVPEPNTITEISIYASIQEELTRLAHSRLSQRLNGIGRKIFALIAGDELRHHHFYNTIAKSIREQFPDEFTKSLYNITKRFDMPGLSIPGFKEHSENIENAGIFTTQDVARTIGKISLDSWDIDTLGDDVIQEDSKELVAKIHKRLATYKRLADIALDKTREAKSQIEWLNGRPVFS